MGFGWIIDVPRWCISLVLSLIKFCLHSKTEIGAPHCIDGLLFIYFFLFDKKKIVGRFELHVNIEIPNSFQKQDFDISHLFPMHVSEKRFLVSICPKSFWTHI